VKDFTLSLEQQSRLRCQLRQPANAQVYRRAAALLALHDGRSANEVAAVLGVTRQTVYNWLSCRGQGNQDLNLEDAPRAGRPSLWTVELDELLQQALQKCPNDFGHAAAHWTAPLLREHLGLFQCPEVSEETVRRRVRRLGYNWTGGRYVRQLEPGPDRAALGTERSPPKTSFRDGTAIAA
jgi:transposase